MIAGRLKYKLQTYRPATDDDRFGEQIAAFVPAGTVRAERVSIAGSRRWEVAEAFADYKVKYRIRAAHTVREGWRVEQLDEPDRLYEVVAVERNADRGFKTLICERVNT